MVGSNFRIIGDRNICMCSNFLVLTVPFMHFKHLSQGHLGEGYGRNWSSSLIVTVNFCKIFFS